MDYKKLAVTFGALCLAVVAKSQWKRRLMQ
jgi:hypothetical protein